MKRRAPMGRIKFNCPDSYYLVHNTYTLTSEHTNTCYATRATPHMGAYSSVHALVGACLAPLRAREARLSIHYREVQWEGGAVDGGSVI